MSQTLQRLKPYRHWLMLLPLCLSGLWFSLMERLIVVPEYVMYTKLDDYIPFLPIFVIPYVIWYAYVALPAFYFFWKSPEDFTRMAMFLAGGMMIACCFYTLLPNGQLLRPNLAGAQGPLNEILRYLYQIDTPNNSAPSIHVVYAVAAHVAIRRYNNRNRRILWVNLVSLVLSVLAIISTVFVKQHSFIDLVAGLALSAVLYLAIYGRQNRMAYRLRVQRQTV